MSLTPNSAVPVLDTLDPVWTRLRVEAEHAADDLAVRGFIHANVLAHETLEESIAYRVSERLHHQSLPGEIIRQTFLDMYEDRPDLSVVLRVDLVAVHDRDPACQRLIEPVLFFKGFHALQAQRLSHWLYHSGRLDFALLIQSRVSEVFQVDIHPAVPIGKGVFIDHGTGVVIGSTAVIEDDVSILQNVTLGGTGKEIGDRHPKIQRCVLIGAGAKILGNIEIGHCSRIASGSVVLKPVPPNTTVAGVPARVVGQAGCPEPSRNMDQMLRDGVGPEPV